VTAANSVWLTTHPSPLAFEVDSASETVALTDQHGETLTATGRGAQQLIVDVQAANRRLWAAHAAPQQLVHGRFLDAIGAPRVWCATTMDRALCPARCKEPVAAGRATAQAVLRFQSAPRTHRERALEVEEEDRLWRAAAKRGYRLDTQFLPRERSIRKVRLDEITAEIGLDVRARQQVKARWLSEHGVKYTVTAEPGWTQPTNCDISAMPAEHAGAWKLYQEGHSIKKRLEILTRIGVDRDEFDRIYPLIEVNTAVTGRMSISDPGMQGWPAELRAAIKAEPGTTVIAFDHSSAEMKVLARMMGNPEFTRKVMEADLYADIAALTGRDRKAEKWRVIAHTYGQTESSLANQVGVGQARATKAAIEAVAPEISQWAAQQTARARRGEQLHTVLGRPLPVLTGESVDTRFSKAANLLVQGSARDFFGLGVRRAAAALGEQALWIPLHDELFVLAPNDAVPETMAKLTEAMTIDLGDGVVLTGTAKVLGNRWGKTD
jgi:hypothetical protein